VADWLKKGNTAEFDNLDDPEESDDSEVPAKRPYIQIHEVLQGALRLNPGIVASERKCALPRFYVSWAMKVRRCAWTGDRCGYLFLPFLPRVPKVGTRRPNKHAIVPTVPTVPT